MSATMERRTPEPGTWLGIPEFPKAAKVGLANAQLRKNQLSGDNVVFSCNCILNYLYSELEGRKTDPFVGPITFGEIAYQLLNQTLVYMEVHDI